MHNIRSPIGIIWVKIKLQKPCIYAGTKTSAWNCSLWIWRTLRATLNSITLQEQVLLYNLSLRWQNEWLCIATLTQPESSSLIRLSVISLISESCSKLWPCENNGLPFVLCSSAGCWFVRPWSLVKCFSAGDNGPFKCDRELWSPHWAIGFNSVSLFNWICVKLA